LREQKVTAFEALLRWNHPLRGIVPPSEFIPLAEETGSSSPWRVVIIGLPRTPRNGRAICAWRSTFRRFIPKHELLSAIVNALAASGLPAHRLELEITEGVCSQQQTDIQMLQHCENSEPRSRWTIRQRLFRTGLFSLVQFDKVKIDQSFVREIATVQRVWRSSARRSARANLGVCATAEGVESLEQLDSLLLEGCTEVQGFCSVAPRRPPTFPT